MSVSVQQADFCLSDFIGTAGDAYGAQVFFLGTVRGQSDDRRLRAMTIEHYPGMSEKMLCAIEQAARGRWALDDCVVVHRYGRLLPGDNIVLVVVRAEHRDCAFDACRFIADWLKTEAPFWKYEEFADGMGQWVAARDSDTQAKERWAE